MKDNIQTSFVMAFLGTGLALQVCGCAKTEVAKTTSHPVKLEAVALKSYLRKYAQESAGEHACGIYYQNTKVGYLITKSKIVQIGGKDFFEVILETQLKMQKDKQDLNAKTIDRKLYQLDGRGELESAERKEDNDGILQTFTLERNKAGYILTDNDTKSKIAVADAVTCLGYEAQISDWLKSKPKVGDKFEHKSAGFSKGKWAETTTTYNYFNGRTIMLHGVPTTIHSLLGSDDTDSSKTHAEVDSNGTLLRGDMGIFSFRFEDISQAKNLSANGLDIVEISRVPLNMDMGETKALSLVVMRVRGLSATPPNSRRQTLLSKGKDGSQAFQIMRDEIKSAGNILSKEENAKYLSDSPSLQIHEPEIKSAAAEAVGQEKNRLKQAQLLMNFVHTRLAKNANRNSEKAVVVLKNAAGDCTEHALVFQSLARSLGMPTREILGMAYVQLPEPAYYWHTWNEIHDGKNWISIDPTWNEIFVDAAHFELEREGEADINMMNSVGQMQIEILSYERGVAQKSIIRKNDSKSIKPKQTKPAKKQITAHSSKKVIEEKKPRIIEEFKGSHFSEVQVEPLPQTRKPNSN
ncbi:MAG: transglutaminase domain-containing protein [Leptolyngbya sp.]|nr:transglutaminase domain-containing protein [Candidatus Melainabacteria bacterium]